MIKLLNPKSVTLGDVLQPKNHLTVATRFTKLLRTLLTFVIIFSLLSVNCTVILWWVLTAPDLSLEYELSILAAVGASWFTITHVLPKHRTIPTTHPLLANDCQGFIANLRLDQKTAVFDGSNIYHFGLDNKIGAEPLGQITKRLRAQNFRLLCFFDANIFFTLKENGEIMGHQSHSVALISRVFGLTKNEVYVVPSGVQADQYILETLKHLPQSFAVTNDKFRDYAPAYDSVLKDNRWRKGVSISGNQIRLFDHNFQTPIHLH